MRSKIKFLVPVLVVLLAVIALTFTLYKPAQTDVRPPPTPLPKLWGYVTYEKWCAPTDHDTVWCEYGIYKQFTLVYQDGSDYMYEFETVLGPEGTRFVHGVQGGDGCITRLYEIYWEFEDIQQDIHFETAP